MRLPAERRHWIEKALRIAAFAVLSLLLVRALRPSSDEQVTAVRTVGVWELVRATREYPIGALHFTLTGTPTRTERAWQEALRNSGSEISWSGGLVPLAIAGRAIGSPLGGHIVSVSAPPNKTLRLRDDISALDSLNAHDGIASLPVAVGFGSLRAVAGRDSASVALTDAATVRRILVLGKAGWETKFLVTALEEAGWNVDASISVAPNVAVSQGTTTIDTAHYSGVIALDESAETRAREVSTFVRSGGGLILGSSAARSEAFGALRVSQPGPVLEILNSEDSVSHATAPFTSMQLPSDGIPIERHRDGVSVAARRVGFGRVAQIGYAETWRWRLQGNDVGKSEHRDWWTQLLSQVVHTPRSTPRQTLDDVAPYAELVDIAGAPIPAVRSPAPLTSQSGEMMLMLVLFALLLMEWASRRLRGAR